MKLYIIYKDDGPVGVCGQTVDITNPREKLYIISGKNEEKIRLELKKLENDVTNLRRVRLNARLTGGYWEGNEWEQDDVKRISTESDMNSSDEIEARFRSWYEEKYGSAYFGAVPLVVLIEWSKTLFNQAHPQPAPPDDDTQGNPLLRCHHPDGCTCVLLWGYSNPDPVCAWTIPTTIPQPEILK
jgi:hypothetical protein